MKKKAILIGAALLGAAITAIPFQSFTNSTGAPAGRSGSDGATCAAAGCHGGTPVSNPSYASINLTDMGLNPETTYIPGKTYLINITINDPGHNAFGFQASVRDKLNTKDFGSIAQASGFSGVKIIPGPTGTNKKYATHTNPSPAVADPSSDVWVFQWTAPANSEGDAVKIYAAINSANGDGGSGGDKISVLTRTFDKSPLASIAGQNTAVLSISVDRWNESLKVEGLKGEAEIQVFSLTGQLLRSGKIQGDGRFSIQGIGSGAYAARVITGGGMVSTVRFVK